MKNISSNKEQPPGSFSILTRIYASLKKTLCDYVAKTQFPHFTRNSCGYLRIISTTATYLAIFKCRQSTPKNFATNHKIKHFI